VGDTQINQRFTNKVATVAGGTGGLGREVTRAFLSEGCKVTVTYRDQIELDALKREVEATAAALTGLKVDVTDETAVRQLIDKVVADNGRIDCLVNAVGAFAGGSNLWETDSKTFDQMIALNLRSGYVLARAVIPAMIKHKSGCIVNVASKAAVDHGAGASAYAASKAGAVALMDSLAAEVKGSGVRVNSILPSIIDTEANRKAMPGADFVKWPKPEEIARVILFLCSDDAKLVHGASIPVYGGS